jgi:hypothetical protein
VVQGSATAAVNLFSGDAYVDNDVINVADDTISVIDE